MNVRQYLLPRAGSRNRARDRGYAGGTPDPDTDLENLTSVNRTRVFRPLAASGTRKRWLSTHQALGSVTAIDDCEDVATASDDLLLCSGGRPIVVPLPILVP
ncbi:hypothetical protein GCM10017566_45360 [Amycolatopsis bartoniae]|uniref:Uncharacterized protein n=1 Tax=Amycolatopsis bartoniae TaxID=941986 RepID=A0A8H9MDW6_9PSEU|nr:hypothetical protein GCM10017566_45360 [Amycolatopsis bartoniae]